MKSKNRIKDVKLAFDQKKHDQQLEKFEAEQLTDKQNEAFAQCRMKWKNFSDRIKALGAKKKVTPQVILQEMHKLIAQIQPYLKVMSDQARDMTLQMLEDAQAKVIATDGGVVGSVRQFVPEGVDKIPDTFQFTTREELESIPFIRAFSSQDGFIGFALDWNRLIALYEKQNQQNDMPIVGTIIIPRSLRRQKWYPTLEHIAQEMEKELAKKN